MKSEALNERQRIRRKLSNNIVTKRYEKTKKGFLVRCYRNMMSRVRGVQKLKAHLYENKELLDRSLFYEWSLNDKSFNSLFDTWKDSGFDRKLSPSIDRRDSNNGYSFSNIRWITHSENSKLGAMSRHSKNN